MNITKQMRQELGVLSKDVFGSSSRWEKLVDRGYTDAVTQEVDEVVPAEKEGDEPTTKKTRQLVSATKNGGTLYRLYFHDVDSIKTYMLERKVQLDNIREMMRKSQEEAKQKAVDAEEAKKLQDKVGGSAI